MFFSVFSTFSKVSALDGYYADTYQKGDKFKLVKNAYKYNYEKSLFNNNFKQDDSSAYLFEKGDVVQYLGNWGTSGIWNISYYMEVQSLDGKKRGYINCANIEKFELSRPESLESFISKYNVKSLNYTQLAKIADDYTTNDNRNNRRELDKNYQSCVTNGETSGTVAKSYCTNGYKDALLFPVTDSKDSNFMLHAYYYGYIYCQIEKADKIKETASSDDPVKQFEKAEETYKNATDTKTKEAAAIALKDAYNGMSAEQKKEYNQRYNSIMNETGSKIGDSIDEADQNTEAKLANVLYKSPVAKTDKDTVDTLNDVIGDAEGILNHNSQIDRDSIKNFSQSIYSIFLTVGIVVTVIVGAILGLKFMMSSVEGKAEVKKMLVAYAVGCVVVFASFGIWKIVVTVLQNI